MDKRFSVFATSIGRKLVMAMSGLFLVIFLIVHAAGNLALFRSDYGKFFNQYSEFMSHNPIIQIIQWVLFAGILVHIYMAYRLAAKNAAARPVSYHVNRPNENSTLFSRSMVITGTIIGLFLVLHIYSFFFRYHYGAPRWISYDGGATYYKDMYNMVEAAFSNQATASLLCGAFYLLALVFLFSHLIHGIQSSMRTTGVNHKKYQATIALLSTGLTALFFITFSSMPLAFMTGAKSQFKAEAQVNLDPALAQRPNPAGLESEENGEKPNIIIVPGGPDGLPNTGNASEIKELSQN